MMGLNFSKSDHWDMRDYRHLNSIPEKATAGFISLKEHSISTGRIHYSIVDEMAMHNLPSNPGLHV